MRPSLLLGLVLLAACNESGGPRSGVLPGGGVSPAPAQLAYAANPAVYTRNVPVARNVATLTGDPSTFSVMPSLPPGLVLDLGTGTISGTPTAVVPRTDFTVTATNSAGSDQVTLTLAVQPGPEPPTGLAYGLSAAVYVAGEPIDENVPDVDGQPTSWSVAPPLPPGLALDAFTGAIRGTPVTASPQTDYTVTAQNVAGSATAVVRIAVLSASSAMRIDLASHGFGVLLPHRIERLDAGGMPSGTLIGIRTLADLVDNATPTNGVVAPTAWPPMAILPDGAPGNHFFWVRFTQPLDPASVFSLLASASTSSNLSGTIAVEAVDTSTGTSTKVRGRGFVNGFTPGSPNPSDPQQLLLERWVELALGGPAALDVGGATPGLGFPGTQSAVPFQGAADLVRTDTFVFVADTDGDLTTHETFPPGVQLRFSILTPRSTQGVALLEPGVASSVVGADGQRPEAQGDFAPAMGAVDVDPATNVEVRFTEPVQPLSVGRLRADAPASGGVLVRFGPVSSMTDVQLVARPKSVYDLTRWVLDPVLDLPGTGSADLACNLYATVEVEVLPHVVTDLKGNVNDLALSSFFETGVGKAVVNAPVTPDAILVGRTGARPGISLIDLNGFGAGTGDPTFDPADPDTPGHSNYPNNPNLVNASALVPPLPTQGTCTLDGGSEGPFTLAKSSALDDLLAGPPLLSAVADMALGHALDTTFNDGTGAAGCRSAAGNPCANDAHKELVAKLATLSSLEPGDPAVDPVVGGAENTVSWAPHPNPPPLVFPRLCSTPEIGALEPTSIEVALPNRLEPSALFLGDPSLDLPPQGLPAAEQNAFFVGPSPETVTCSQAQIRQQIGYFLYVCDPLREEVVVLNSNRFTVLDRIAVDGPVALAVSPNLDLLAVTSQSQHAVVFIDVDPTSGSFHQIVATTAVGTNPAGLAWEPGSEELLVCNEGSGSLSIVSADTLAVRKTVTRSLTSPFDVVVGQRQLGFGLERSVYFAFVLNRDGTLAVFESGPDGPGGLGYDDVVAVAPFPFEEPKAIALDPTALGGGCWIAHEDPLDPVTGKPVVGGGGAVTGVVFTGDPGDHPIDPSTTPFLRDMKLEIVASLGPRTITGVPTGLAFDDLRNLGGLRNSVSPAASAVPVAVNGKSHVRSLGTVSVPTSSPRFLFVAVPLSTQGSGVVDVLRVDAGYERLDVDPHEAGVQSIAVEGGTILTSFFSR